MYAFILGVGVRAAVPMSKSTILGAAIGNFCSISVQRHPRAERPLIDYEVATLMMSGKLLGVIFGVILNEMLPKLLLIIFMVLILSYSGMRTVRKGLNSYAKETEEMERKKLDDDDDAKAADDRDSGKNAAG